MGAACLATWSEPALADAGDLPSPLEAQQTTGIALADEGSSYEAGQVLVTLRRGTTLTQAQALVGQADSLARSYLEPDDLVGASVRNGIIADDADLDPVLQLELADGITVAQAAAELSQDECVADVQPSWLLSLEDDGAGTPDQLDPQTTSVNDPSASRQWGLGAMQLPSAWDLTRSNHEVAVAVFDTGVRTTHEDLRNNLIAQYNAYEKGADVSDGKNHGTHVAGIACAQANNGLGIAGTSYNANLVAVKVSDKYGSRMTPAAVIEAYNYLLSHKALGVRVVNLSVGAAVSSTSAFGDALCQRITAAKNAGILTVSSAGNGSGAYRCYPADYDDCLSVINVAKSDGGYVRSSTSNYNMPGVGPTTKNSTKDISAPGAGIYSTVNSSDSAYGNDSGTSMASPAVAGIAALCFARNPSLTPAQVQSILQSTATDLGDAGWDRQFGYGLVNARAALAKISQAKPAVKNVTMFRLYNPNSGEHFYTASTNERDTLVRLGWRSEGNGWTSPSYSSVPVYRMYNPNAGDHHYTTSTTERSALVRAGWTYEGVGWYSGGSRPLWRQYNPNARTGTHNYTLSTHERDVLIRLGWRNEGIGWYGV